MCAVLVSEENEDPIIIPKEKQGKYCVAFDPLDGSSNIDCNVSTGTIFAVYEKHVGSVGDIDDVMRAGIDIKVAGYCMCVPATS
jgi:fructose-1,6-bisphosphatase I